jgi:ArsR family transcriptional regulator
MGSEKQIGEMEKFFLAFADKTRLRILNLMREGEICVYFLVEVLNESQPKVSRHLAYLRGAGIVETRREGKWMHYRITTPSDPSAAQLLRNTLTWMDSQEKMQCDYEKLKQICCSSDKTITLTQMPKSNTFVKSNINNKPGGELEIFLL